MMCTLTGELTIARVEEVKAVLLKALAQGGSLELDTKQVSEVDAAGLQVVLAALKSAAKAKVPVHFPVEARGAAVSTGFHLLGIGEPIWSE
jgi:anti-anti-sigma regulatory factor